MNPSRYKTVNGNLVEEFYWAGRYVVYINNRKFDGTYEEALSGLSAEKGAEK